MTTLSPEIAAPRRKKFLPFVKRTLSAFLQGLLTPIRGAAFLFNHRTLWPHVLLPLAISLAISLVILATLTAVAVFLIPWMHHWSFFSSNWTGRLAEAATILLLIVACLAAAIATYLLASGILLGRAHERLAKHTEILLGTPPEDLREAPWKYQIIDGILDFFIVTGTCTLCFAFGCIPVVGFLAAAVNFYVDWWVLGYDFFEIPLSLRGMRRTSKRAFAKKHRPQILGLGAAAFALTLLPLIGPLLLTTAAIGSVLLHHQLSATAEGDAPPGG